MSKKKEVKTVQMVRKLAEGKKGPTKADVHPEEVANFMAAGWVKK